MPASAKFFSSISKRRLLSAKEILTGTFSKNKSTIKKYSTPDIATLNDSIFRFLESESYEKKDKVSRIDALWSYCGDKLNVEEINPAELKFDLIKTANMKAEVMIEEELLPLKKEIRIIDESFELIRSTENQIVSMEEDIKNLEQHEQELIDYKNTTLANAEKVPFGLRRLNSLIVGEIDQEMEVNKHALASTRKSLTTLIGKLNKKFTLVLGENFTLKQKEDFLLGLQNKKSELEKKIETVRGKQEALVRLFQAQYDAEEKAELHSVPKITEELTRKILEK